ncbi:MAG TPA: hypothetical protein VIH37_12015, partial [Candidatus Limnocylindrales bacterium]
PAVATNRVGDWDVAGREGFAFPGQATIVDGNGTVRAQLGGDEGIVVADVALDPTTKTHRAPAAHGRYIYPGPPGREILRVIEWREGRRYRRNSERAAAVRDVELAVPTG